MRVSLRRTFVMAFTLCLAFRLVAMGQVIDGIQIKDGMLLKSNQQDISYVYSNGKRHHIPDPETHNCLGGDSAARFFNQDQLDTLQDGAPFPSICIHEGMLIKSKQQDISYIYSNGKRHHIPDPETHNCLGGDSAAHFFDQNQLDALPDGEAFPSICVKEGWLIKSRQHDISYIFSEGKRHHVPDPGTFCHLGGDRAAHFFDQNKLDALPDGDPVARFIPPCFISDPTIKTRRPAGVHIEITKACKAGDWKVLFNDTDKSIIAVVHENVVGMHSSSVDKTFPLGPHRQQELGCTFGEDASQWSWTLLSYK